MHLSSYGREETRALCTSRSLVTGCAAPAGRAKSGGEGSGGDAADSKFGASVSWGLSLRRLRERFSEAER